MKRLLVLAMALSLTAAAGCVKKRAEAPPPAAAQVEAPAPPPAAPAPPPPSPRGLYEREYAKLPRTHTVAKGDSLWRIAGQKSVYNDPFLWPLLREANRDKIGKRNLIRPGQVLTIPREGMTLDQVLDARRKAGAGRKGQQPPSSAVLPVAVREQLGYGF